MKMRLANPTLATLIYAAALLFCCLSAQSAQAQLPKPQFKLIGVHLPTHYSPGDKGRLMLVAANYGGAPTSGQITLTDTLPDELTVTNIEERVNDPDSPDPDCVKTGQEITCTIDGPIDPGRQIEIQIVFQVDSLATPGQLPDQATISGGGASEVTIDTTATIGPPPPFGFLPHDEGGPELLLTEEDASDATLAGSHPYQLTSSLGFPTEAVLEGFLIGAETPRDIVVDFPRGLIVNPTAAPVLCTEAELVLQDDPGAVSCPLASQVGLITVITNEAFPKAATSPLYSMVPPPGTPAMLAFDAAGAGVFIHLKGEVRSDGDFGLTGATYDALALTGNPVFGARVELWGDPSADIHDQARGACVFDAGACSESVDPGEAALLAMPVHCPGGQLATGFRANSWQQPGDFATASVASAGVKDCGALDFEPTIEAQPTTTLADQPSGFRFTLKQPQDLDLGGLSPTVLKDALVTLPKELVVNPSAAQGQEACTPDQIGLKSGVGKAPVRFNKVPDSCPDAAKIGTIEVKTPLLAELTDSETEFERDLGGDPIPRSIGGDVYLAEPFQNPFGSLLAIYFAVEDPRSGTVAKFATKVQADPVTGQLRNVLTESPQLPLEEVSLKIFDGSRAALRTPPACAPYTTTTELTPWGAPEEPSAAPTDSFAITATPRGGACPASADAAPHSPGFVAGTLAPRAGAFSPFVLRVTREDATQPIGGFEATLPPGLSAKLAGVPVCSDAEIAQAEGRGDPNEGKIELASPSCPASTEIGSIEVAAGAGPDPFRTSGRVYLAGPYKGAPLSAVIITPAVAGPFDLGTVVVRTALYVDEKTAQVRAVSDPLPTILEGIPLDLRSAVVRMGRPQFTLNPTSCEPFAVSALATSVFGQGASLQSPFRARDCADLPFEPKLALRLFGGTKRGAHPRLQGTLTMKGGEANIAATSVALPRSEFLDQSHIRTVCTRVQFAAEQCPAGAIYGHVKAMTPLLDEVLEGPIYLRSSDNELPDAVGVLRGPPHRPIQIEVSARIDSFKRGIRANFEAVPDAPVSKVVVTMQGGAKGLLINSRNLCKTKKALRSATVRMVGQNGKTHNSRPVLKNQCKRGGKKRRARPGR